MEANDAIANCTPPSEAGEEEKTASGDVVDTEKDVSLPTELPKTFSLLARVSDHIPLDITARDLLSASHQRVSNPSEFKPIFDENPPPAALVPEPPRVEGETLKRETPVYTVKSKKDATSRELHDFCEKAPIVLVRDLASTVGMNMNLFSTDQLLKQSPNQRVETRHQKKLPSDLNVDEQGFPTWIVNIFPRKHMPLKEYAMYQKDHKQQSERADEPHHRRAASDRAKRRRYDDDNTDELNLEDIKFGTNIDLDNRVLFKPQLNELTKLPAFVRYEDDINILSHLGHYVLGMNTVQMYMKVPGNRTPGHVENNCLASVNINIGPGDCEWFGVPYEYYGVIDRKCREKGTDFLKGAWWPDPEELMQEGVPLYRFTQKAGDLVWVGPGCVHWVQSLGWCNNVAWNVGPLTHSQLTLAVHQFEWNKIQTYKSLVPMNHLFWRIAKCVPVTDLQLYKLVREKLILSLSHLKYIADWVEKSGKTIEYKERFEGEFAYYCDTPSCEVEVFNILFAKPNKRGIIKTACVDCVRKRGIEDYSVYQQISFDELSSIFDNFKPPVTESESSPPSSHEASPVL